VLMRICLEYGTGDADPGEQGGYQKVMWKQFAIDFDDIPATNDLQSDWSEVLADPALYAELRTLRVAAESKRLDMTDAFSEYAGTGRDANLGVMQKNRFRSAMGTLFQGINLRTATLDAICRIYGTGDADPRDPGTHQKVFWKQFAIDFDNIPLPDGPEKPDPTPEILEAMRDMNIYCNHHGINLESDLEEFMGGSNFNIMSRTKFKQALGVLLGKASSLYRLD